MNDSSKRHMQPCTEKYVIDDEFMELAYKVPKGSCGLCTHLTDVFWDYTHGPYMFISEKVDDAIEAGGPYGNCDHFMPRAE